MPAVLWATHSYAPSSLPEAWGISHDALTEDLQLQKNWQVKAMSPKVQPLITNMHLTCTEIHLRTRIGSRIEIIRLKI